MLIQNHIQALREMAQLELKRYPSCCTSAMCSHVSSDVECQTCPNRYILDSFNAWRESTKAECVDPIWDPNLFRSSHV